MNKIFAILIMCSLSLPVLAIEEQEVGMTPSNQETIETVEPEVLSEENYRSEEQKIAPLPSKYKEPLGKKKLAKKFIIAMLCVAGTSIFLYSALSIYNKFRDGVIANNQSTPEGEQSLVASTDITEAVKTFVEKTRWD